MRPSSAIAVGTTFVALYGVHAASYGSWIVDDAAISFAYARNLAAGHGLVAQPGAVPVEGFSNALWVLLLAGWDRLGAFDPVWTPKILSGAMVAGALLLSWRTMARDGDAAVRASSCACIAAAANPALVIWSMSGLENGMLVLLAAGMFVLLHRVLARGANVRGAIAAAVVAVALSFVRPDAALWIAAWPAAAVVAGCRPMPIGPWMAYAGTGLALGCAALWARYDTFGSIVPNTFHVKQGEGVGRLVIPCVAVPVVVVLVRWFGRRVPKDVPRLLALVGCIAVFAWLARPLWRASFGWAGSVVGLGLLVAFARVRALTPGLAAAAIGATVAATAYLALPRDWMGEYRFATAFVPFSLLLGFGLAAEWCGANSRRWVVAAALAAACLVPDSVVRWWRFRAAPTVPVAVVAADHAPFERYRSVVGGTRSLLTEDVGAPLLFSSLRIHDLGGLCEPVIGRTLFRDPSRLGDHVFDVLRPDFVRLSADVAIRCGLQADPRFRRDYVAIREWRSPARVGDSGVPLGHFVRRDVLADEGLLEAMRSLAPR